MGHATLVILSLYAYLCSGYSYLEPRDPSENCNTGRISYCSDCLTVEICQQRMKWVAASSPSPIAISSSTTPSPSPSSSPPTSTSSKGPPTPQNCTAGTLCMQTSTYAVCEPASEVPNCECPPTGITAIPDAYDNQKYIICVDGTGTIETCQGGAYYHPDTQDCQPTPVSTTTPKPTTCGSTVEVIPVNCTAYQLCIPNSDPIVSACGPGEIATDDQSHPCKFYEPFDCADYEGPIYTADTTNCSVGHFCVDGEETGQPVICGEDQSFDNATKVCIDDPNGNACSALEDCGICQDNTTRITIDCYSYYQCSDGTGEEGELPFIAILKNCPTGTYYDPSEEICSQNVPEGCEEKTKFINL